MAIKDGALLKKLVAASSAFKVIVNFKRKLLNLLKSFLNGERNQFSREQNRISLCYMIAALLMSYSWHYAVIFAAGFSFPCNLDIKSECIQIIAHIQTHAYTHTYTHIHIQTHKKSDYLAKIPENSYLKIRCRFNSASWKIAK